MAERDRRPEDVRSNVPAVQASPSDDEATIDLMELSIKLLAKWKLILAVALISAVVSGVVTMLFITPKYEATATIYVLSRKDSAINISDLQIGAALTSDYIEVFNMWEVHEEVISNLNLPYSYDQMRRMLKVINPSGTRMLDISFTSETPHEASTVANEYAKVASQYIADTMSTDKPNIMSVALTPTAPVSPNKTRNVMLGFLLGAFLTIGVISAHFVLDDKIKTTDDIRKYIGLNTLAAIPDEDMDFEYERKYAKSRGGRR